MGLRKVRRGTPDFSAPTLCETCKYSTIIRGIAYKEEIVQCNALGGRQIPFKVAECPRFLHNSHPAMHEMEEIAWIIVTRSTMDKIGFVRVKDMTMEQRQKLMNYPRPVGY